MSRMWRTLTARLVLIAVGLVAVTTVVIALSTTVLMRDYLTDRLDRDVAAALNRSLAPRPPRPGQSGQQPGDRDVADLLLGSERRGNQPPGTLLAAPGSERGRVLADELGEGERLEAEDFDVLRGVPTDGTVVSVEVGDDEFRAMARETPLGLVVIGLPTEPVRETVGSLVRLELGLGLAATVLAGLVASSVVRRQLRPLREVADTAQSVAAVPMSTGAVAVPERVPPHLSDADNEVGRVGAALNDLLDHVEQSLNSRHRSEQLLRQFVADASHELRTPLATISGYTELARKHPEDPGTAGTALAKVEEESGRMTMLVEDLLLLARLDAGHAVEHEAVDLTRVLLEALEDQRILGPRHRFEFTAPSEPVTVVGDERRIHQVISNLLTNARKHTPAGTRVVVEVLPDGFSVTDDGPGVPPELRDRVFERFTRADEARQRDGGAGLGLALVQAILAAMDATITLGTRPGHTHFQVVFPPPV